MIQTNIGGFLVVLAILMIVSLWFGRTYIKLAWLSLIPIKLPKPLETGQIPEGATFAANGKKWIYRKGRWAETDSSTDVTQDLQRTRPNPYLTPDEIQRFDRNISSEEFIQLHVNKPTREIPVPPDFSFGSIAYQEAELGRKYRKGLPPRSSGGFVGSSPTIIEPDAGARKSIEDDPSAQNLRRLEPDQD